MSGWASPGRRRHRPRRINATDGSERDRVPQRIRGGEGRASCLTRNDSLHEGALVDGAPRRSLALAARCRQLVPVVAHACSATGVRAGRLDVDRREQQSISDDDAARACFADPMCLQLPQGARHSAAAALTKHVAVQVIDVQVTQREGGCDNRAETLDGAVRVTPVATRLQHGWQRRGGGPLAASESRNGRAPS